MVIIRSELSCGGSMVIWAPDSSLILLIRSPPFPIIVPPSSFGIVTCNGKKIFKKPLDEVHFVQTLVSALEPLLKSNFLKNIAELKPQCSWTHDPAISDRKQPSYCAPSVSTVHINQYSKTNFIKQDLTKSPLKQRWRPKQNVKLLTTRTFCLFPSNGHSQQQHKFTIAKKQKKLSFKNGSPITHFNQQYQTKNNFTKWRHKLSKKNKTEFLRLKTH